MARYFQDLILWGQSLHLLRAGKTLNSLTVDVYSLWLAETTCKNMCLLACTLPSPKSHIHCFLCLLRAVSQRYWKCCLPGYSLYFAPNKLNLKLSYCVYVFFFKSAKVREWSLHVPLFRAKWAGAKKADREATVSKCVLEASEEEISSKRMWLSESMPLKRKVQDWELALVFSYRVVTESGLNLCFFSGVVIHTSLLWQFETEWEKSKQLVRTILLRFPVNKTKDIES